MLQNERRLYLIEYLLNEEPRYKNIDIPSSDEKQKRLLRALMNVRPPRKAGKDFLAVQDEYLQNELAEKGINDYKSLVPVEKDIYLWQGDITMLKCDAIVNAANSGMTGCYSPNHNCIDNAIHTFAGVQLRAACAEIMARQGHNEAAGQAKITPGYNLPCKYVLHTVGPIIRGKVQKEDERLLASCYLSCLKLAREKELKSVAFCCISTGVFGFPNKRAAEIAVDTVKNFKTETGCKTEVIFNVFKKLDCEIYRKLLGRRKKTRT